MCVCVCVITEEIILSVNPRYKRNKTFATSNNFSRRVPVRFSFCIFFPLFPPIVRDEEYDRKQAARTGASAGGGILYGRGVECARARVTKIAGSVWLPLSESVN